jgi:1,4-alpha-glucan branching enzyme
VAAVANFTPVPRTGYRVGLPCAGRWREILNTDAAEYGGSGCGNGGAVRTENIPSHGEAQSAAITVPPLASTSWRGLSANTSCQVPAAAQTSS